MSPGRIAYRLAQIICSSDWLEANTRHRKDDSLKFYRRHWYTVNLIFALAGIVVAITSWNALGVVRGLLLLNFIVFILHQFEEYGWPGGEPWIINRLMRPSGDRPDRFPLNQNAAMVTNAFIGVPIYLIPVFFPQLIWLGLGPVLVGFSQFLIHGIAVNIKLRWFYNGGLLAVVAGHVPVGVIYIVYVSMHGMASGWDWLFGVVYFFAIMIFGLVLPTYRWMADANSPYLFDANEMLRFNAAARLARARKMST